VMVAFQNLYAEFSEVAPWKFPSNFFITFIAIAVVNGGVVRTSSRKLARKSIVPTADILTKLNLCKLFAMLHAVVAVSVSALMKDK
jgi:hypothetical protein